MANPKLVVEIIANTEALLKNLAAGKGAIEAYGPTIAKMQETWNRNSALVVDKAATITAALKGIEVGTLTAADAAKNLRVLEAGMAQLSAAGRPIPAQMTQTAEALRHVTGATTAAAPPMSLLASGMSRLMGYFTIGALVAWTANLIDAAGRLQDLKERTDINVVALQRYNVIARQSGSTLDAVSNAVFIMGKRLAGDDKSAAAAVRELGLNFDELRAMGPERAFDAIGKAIATIPDPMKQAELGAKVFGRSVQELIPVFKHLNDETGPFITLNQAQVTTLDDLGDSYERVKASIIPLIMKLVDLKFHMSAYAEDLKIIDVMQGKVALTGPAVQGLAKYIAEQKASNDVRGGTITQGYELDRIEKELTAGIAKQAVAVREAAAEAKKAADVQEKFLAEVTKSTLGLYEHNSILVLNLHGYQGLREGIDDVITSTAVATNATGLMSAATQHMYMLHPPLLDVEQQHVATLGDLSQALTQLAQVSGDAFGGIVRNLGQMVVAINVVDTAMRAFTTTGQANLMSFATTFTSVYGAIQTGVDALNQAFGLTTPQAMQATYDANRELLRSTMEAHGGLDAFRAELIASGHTLDWLVSHLAEKNFATILAGALGDVTKTATEASLALAGLPSAVNAINSATVNPIVIPVEWGDPGAMPEPTYGAQGGLATARGVVYAAAGRLLPFASRGTDTVPAMLTPGEGVLSVRDMQALGGPSGFSALRQDLRTGGRGQVYDFSAMKAEIIALRRDLVRQNRQLPHLLATAMQDIAARR